MRPERLLGAGRLVPSGPPSLRAGVQLGLRPSCRTRLVVCREFELRPRAVSDDKGPQARKSMVRPERFELPASWFVARRAADTGNLTIISTCFYSTSLAGCPLQIHPRARRSTTEHNRLPQKSRNLMVSSGRPTSAGRIELCTTAAEELTAVFRGSQSSPHRAAPSASIRTRAPNWGRHADFQFFGGLRGLSINHLQRLPTPFPGTPRHNPGTGSAGSTGNRVRRSAARIIR